VEQRLLVAPPVEANHAEWSVGDTGIVIKEWMTWVRGAVRGAGKVTERESNARSRGGSKLLAFSNFWDGKYAANGNAPV
jgi:hypothetical protein